MLQHVTVRSLVVRLFARATHQPRLKKSGAETALGGGREPCDFLCFVEVEVTLP
jgi:hypothetical protein